MTSDEQLGHYVTKRHLARQYLKWTTDAATEAERVGLSRVADYFRDRGQEAESDLKAFRLPFDT